MGDVNIITKYMNELREKFKITFDFTKNGQPLREGEPSPFSLTKNSPFIFIDYLNII